MSSPADGQPCKVKSTRRELQTQTYEKLHQRRGRRALPLAKWSVEHCSTKTLVLAVEDAERLLQRLDLLLAARNAVLVAHAGINARPRR